LKNQVRTKILQKYVFPSTPLQTNLDTDALRTSKPGYVGVRDSKQEKAAGANKEHLWTLTDVLDRFDLELVEWDGWFVFITSGKYSLITVIPQYCNTFT
jgi:hypothetical protein